MIKLFLRDERGATAIEYVIIGSLLSILIVAGATVIGKGLNTRAFTPLAANLS